MLKATPLYAVKSEEEKEDPILIVEMHYAKVFSDNFTMDAR